MKGFAKLVSLVFCCIICFSLTYPLFKVEHPDWGFYGHRLINRYAVYCLPQDVILFYKQNIDYVSEHSVDPDKRRYATKHEAHRHYIDIDAFGTYPFPEVPRTFDEALMKYAHYRFVEGSDTATYKAVLTSDSLYLMDVDSSIVLENTKKDFKVFFRDYIRPQYYEDEWRLASDTVEATLGMKGELIVVDHFSNEGILPYHLQSMKYQLTKAFTDQDIAKILRLSAEFGHYIGDAHVPLHTTRNYNGQLTDQVGIHAFWESRIPELFAEEEYSFLVGRAEYIENTQDYFWDIILKSHSLLEDVLGIEKELSKTFPEDKQYCYDERLERTIRVHCPEYAKAYQEQMNGMVEDRMQDAILSISSIWYTCWVDGGQPKLSKGTIEIGPVEIEFNPEVKTRSHE